jgi:tRNA(fMet)-specific endonuclease VapC
VKYLLDTNHCIAVINRDVRIKATLERHPASALRLSTISLAELRYGIAKSTKVDESQARLRQMLGKITPVPFDDEATERYGELRELLERRGTPIGPMDTLIAAHALALGWTLVTGNARELRRVPGLKVEDWLT